jgi:hypothetical protein
VGPCGTLVWEGDDDPPADLLAELSAHKAELLAALDVPADPGELLARVEALEAEPAWARAWCERFKVGSSADHQIQPSQQAQQVLDAVRRTTRDMIALAAERHRAGDIPDFRAWCNYTLDHAAGRNWDEAAARPLPWPPDLEIITAEEAAATFADFEASRHRRRGN